MKKHHLTSKLLMLKLAFIVIIYFGSCNKTVVTPEKPHEDTPEQPSTPNPPVKGKEYTLLPDANGRLVIDGAKSPYKGGDALNLKGRFYSVNITNLNGSPGNPITIRNFDGTSVKIGNPDWNGGSWAEALSLINCHYIRVGSESSRADFIIDGSVHPARDAYFNLVLSKHTDNIEIRNLTIRNGGTGIWAKTDPVKGDATTYYPNSQMENLLIHDVAISGTNNEAMYIGHTATYWDLTANTSYYGDASGFTPGSQYVQPIKWHNVKIYNNAVQDGGADGIQTAAIDQLEVFNNTVTNWGMKHNSSHNGGILIGGRATNTYVHDNYVHDGWGELLQFYGSGENGSKHVISNNLFVNNSQGGNDGISFRGTDRAAVTISNNTVALTGGVSLRINGEKGMTAALTVTDNAFIQPRMSGGSITYNSYVYTENGGGAIEGTGDKANSRFPTLDAAGVDVGNYFAPKAGSALGVTGFRKK
ncbi:right-handed parallel beta-helix repeat-containing protein [Chitinophaga sp. 22536]|nr:right-handed parallel beta-helix repeat-containing protein [Chitinophaga varians]